MVFDIIDFLNFKFRKLLPFAANGKVIRYYLVVGMAIIWDEIKGLKEDGQFAGFIGLNILEATITQHRQRGILFCVSFMSENTGSRDQCPHFIYIIFKKILCSSSGFLRGQVTTSKYRNKPSRIIHYIRLISTLL